LQKTQSAYKYNKNNGKKKMKRLIIISLLFLIPGALFSNSGPEKSIEVYTSANCPKCNAAINFLKKNWGPVGWNTVPKVLLFIPSPIKNTGISLNPCSVIRQNSG
jgi:hypothetical protein